MRNFLLILGLSLGTIFVLGSHSKLDAQQYGGFLFKRFASPFIGRLLSGFRRPPVRTGYAPNSPLPQQKVGGVDIQPHIPTRKVRTLC